MAHVLGVLVASHWPSGVDLNSALVPDQLSPMLGRWARCGGRSQGPHPLLEPSATLLSLAPLGNTVFFLSVFFTSLTLSH
jgi:hypothetical protein